MSPLPETAPTSPVLDINCGARAERFRGSIMARVEAQNLVVKLREPRPSSAGYSIRFRRTEPLASSGLGYQPRLEALILVRSPGRRARGIHFAKTRASETTAPRMTTV